MKTIEVKELEQRLELGGWVSQGGAGGAGGAGTPSGNGGDGGDGGAATTTIGVNVETAPAPTTPAPTAPPAGK